MKSPRHTLSLGAAITAALALAPAAADAAFVSRVGDRLEYFASDGDPTNLAVSTNASEITFRERGGLRITSGCGITAATAQVTCSLAGVNDVLVSVRDGRNTVESTVGDLDLRSYAIVASDASSANEFRHTGRTPAKLLGGNGPDRLESGTGGDTLNGRGGNDTLLPLKGNDLVDGGTGIDTVSLAARGVPVTVTLDSADNDGSAGERANILTTSEILIGGANSDVLIGSAAGQSISGGPGNDTIRGGAGVDALNGDAGDDDVFGDADNDTVLGAADQDDLSGGAGDDQLFGSAGFDLLDGGDGNDFVSGDAGPDLVSGGAGRDTQLGGEGDDALIPGNGAGNDRRNAGSDADTLVGDAGIDFVDYGKRAGAVSVDFADTVAPDDGEPGERDNVHPSVENAVGGAGADTLTGGPGPNELHGTGGADTIDGGGGVDRLSGGRDGDIVRSQDGVQDTVDCGLGADTLTSDAFDATVFCGPGAEPEDADRDREERGGLVELPEPGRVGDRGPLVRITPGRPVLSAAGVVVLRVRCSGAARRACSGVLRLAGASARFAADSRKSTRVTLRPQRRRLAGARVLAKAAVVDTAGRDWTTERRLVLRAGR